MRKFNNKAQLGLETIKPIMIGFLILSVIAITGILLLVNLRDVTDKIDKSAGSLTNVSTSAQVSNNATFVNVTGLGSLRNCVLTANVVSSTVNATAPCITKIDVGNYSINACSLRFTSVGLVDAACYNNTIWNVTGSFTSAGQSATNILGNISEGSTTFFDDTGTIFSILIVVVIILAISIIIAVVSRFGSGTGVSAGL